MTPHQTTGSQRQKFPGIADMTLFVPLISNDFFFPLAVNSTLGLIFSSHTRQETWS